MERIGPLWAWSGEGRPECRAPTWPDEPICTSLHGLLAAGPAGTQKNEPPPEYIIVEHLSDDLMKCYLSVLVWLVHFDDSQIDDARGHEAPA